MIASTTHLEKPDLPHTYDWHFIAIDTPTMKVRHADCGMTDVFTSAVEAEEWARETHHCPDEPCPECSRPFMAHEGAFCIPREYLTEVPR